MIYNAHIRTTSGDFSKANHIRTKLLLISLSEIPELKKNKTRINSKLSKDLISKYESIEIVIENPVEMGITKRYQSITSLNYNRLMTLNALVAPCGEEINQFVRNLNKTLCSERKLVKVDSQKKNFSDLCQMRSMRDSTKFPKSNTLNLIKESCEYLRHLPSTLLIMNGAILRKGSKKTLTQPQQLKLNFELDEKESNKNGNHTHRHRPKVKFELNGIKVKKTNSNGESQSNNCTPNRSMTPRKPNILKSRTSSTLKLNKEAKLFENGQIKKEKKATSDNQLLTHLNENYNDLIEDKLAMECNVF